VAYKQSVFAQEIKYCLKDGEIVVVGDFAKTYSFIVQDAAQGLYWNNQQALVCPFVCKLKNSNSATGELLHLCYAIISDCLTHDTAAMYTFQKSLISYPKETVQNAKKKRF
jgi:hypothetical protein